MGWGRLAGACLLVVLLAMVVSGCATTPTMTAPTGAGDRTGANGEVTPRVKPGLVLNVSVLVAGKKELDEPAKRVSDDGILTMPLIGEVTAEGLTLTELSRELTLLYEDYFIRPQVVVDFVLGEDDDSVSPWGYVTVLGRVKTPGRVNMPPTQDLTVAGAIQQAGGLDTSAKSSGIRVTRQKPGGGQDSFEIDLQAIGSRGAVRNDMVLQAGDVVFVPEMIF